jgi:hypothetical protein
MKLQRWMNRLTTLLVSAYALVRALTMLVDLFRR